MNTAIIVAAGTGSRFDSAIPKQFLEISGKPMLVRTIERFDGCDAVDEIVLVLAPDQIEAFTPQIGQRNFSKVVNVVPGGETRAQSVTNGLAAVNPLAEVIAVHDGARPLVSSAEIRRTIEKARETGAACLVGGVVDTIKQVEGGFISGTLERNKLRRALTPQAFRYEILVGAFRDADLSEDVTDECFLVERLGIPIAAVEGSSRNIKITHPQDIEFAEMLLAREVAD